jgi:hypothetical protein
VPLRAVTRKIRAGLPAPNRAAGSAAARSNPDPGASNLASDSRGTASATRAPASTNSARASPSTARRRRTRKKPSLRRIGCAAGSLTVQEYRGLLAVAGFVQVDITLTADHGDGVHSAIVQAVKPAIGPGLEIRPMRDSDAEQVLAIYQAGLDTGHASFETTAPWEGFTASRLPHLRYVATDGDCGEVLGWVAASAVSSRPVNVGVVEHSI